MRRCDDAAVVAAVDAATTVETATTVKATAATVKTATTVKATAATVKTATTIEAAAATIEAATVDAELSVTGL
jgi:hypothetical protein